MTGLTAAEAARRLEASGPNEPVRRQRMSALADLARLFANPLVVILLVAATVSGSLGRGTDAAIIVTIVLLGISISFWQTYRSQAAVIRLRASVTTTADVLRDGAWVEIPVRLVVPGDIVRLVAGDLVPADARLIEARDLSVQQAMLTGESLPVDKPADALVFLGTSVVSGTATACVVATGARTQFGDIAARLQSRAPESEFDRGLRHFSLLILRTTVALVLLILLIALALRRDPLESLMFALALGVGLTPEFLPLIASVTLAEGATRLAADGVIVKNLPAIQNLGSIDVLCSDKTGTLTSGEMQVDECVDPDGAASAAPLTLAFLNAFYGTGIRSPLDAAILTRSIDPGRLTKVDEIPFDFERRRSSVVVQREDGTRILITKGAPESVLPLTHAPDRSAINQTLSDRGLRVLAVASREVPQGPSYTREDERDLTLCGFVAFADPILPEVADAVAALHDDGVSMKILTGDNDRVTRYVCERVGLQASAIVSGEEVERLDDAALGHVAEQTAVFTRVSPSQKNRIIQALQRRGHVVGFVGDGINDAPSLHTADVGISVRTATAIARESADVVLGRSGVRVLHGAVVEGRRAAGNLMKYLLMGTSSNFGNMFSMAAASAFLPFLPMLPTQILLNNFLYDLAQITIPSDHVDREYLSRPQRWNMRWVRDFMLMVGPVSSLFDFLTFYALLRILHATQPLFHTGWFVESLATQTLVLFVIRTSRRPWKSRPSVPLASTTIAIVVIGMALPATPLGPILGFVVPPPAYFVFLIVATATYLAMVELVKRRVFARPIDNWPRTGITGSRT